MPPIRSTLAEIGEVVIGVVWWGGAHVWGFLVGTGLIVAPLLLAMVIATVLDPAPAVALGLGVVGAYAFDLWPWDAESAETLGVVVIGAAASAVGWHLTQGTGGIEMLLVAVSVALVGWPIRRAVSLRTAQS